MFTALLVLVYVSFISLGLPDSLLGSAWPVVRADLGVPLAFEGILSMTISGGTIVSSFLSSKVIGKFGTGKTTFVSVAMTAAALIGMSFAPSFVWLCVMAVPLGLGAGAVDAGLNNFVALHYKEKHMNWLHCFWGIGVTLSPLILSAFIGDDGAGWRKGYLTVGIIQTVLVLILVLSLPLWKKAEKAPEGEESAEKFSYKEVFGKTIVRTTLVAFFAYCSVESVMGLWGSSYLVETKTFDVQTAARMVSLYYLGITIGRFLSGLLSMKMSGRSMIRVGQGFVLAGVLLMFLPFGIAPAMVGFVLIGLGCAPIYPSLLHDTPKRVGVKLSQALMGIQMAFAYIGSTFMPPIFGLLAENVSVGIFPFFLLGFAVIMIVATEVTYKLQEKTRVNV